MSFVENTQILNHLTQNNAFRRTFLAVFWPKNMEENGFYHLEYFQQRFSLFWLHWQLTSVRSTNVLFFIGLEMTKRFRLGGHIALIILRILMGIGEGTTFPALSVLLAIWVPAKERSKLGSLVLGGGQVSAIFVANLAIFDVVFFSDFNVKNLFICCVFFRLEVLQPTIYLDWF